MSLGVFFRFNLAFCRKRKAKVQGQEDAQGLALEHGRALLESEPHSRQGPHLFAENGAGDAANGRELLK